MPILVLRRSSCRAIYRYVLWQNFWLQVLCVYGTYPSLHIRQQWTTRTCKQTVNQLGRFSLVEICCNTAVFAINIVLSQWISKRNGIQFWPVAPRSNYRVVFASMLQHVFIASMNERIQHFWLTQDFIFACIIKRYGTFCKDKHTVLLNKSVFLKHSINLDFKGNSMLLISHHLKECCIPWGSCGIPPCNSFLQRGQHSYDKVYHYFEAGPWDVHSIPFEKVHHVFHIFWNKWYFFHRGSIVLSEKDSISPR